MRQWRHEDVDSLEDRRERRRVLMPEVDKAEQKLQGCEAQPSHTSRSELHLPPVTNHRKIARSSQTQLLGLLVSCTSLFN